ncbi:hypothetical protein ACFL9T_18210, partial [Thermodesulfobacteriota bacterium]
MSFFPRKLVSAVLFTCFLALFFSAPSWATNASISVSGNEGAINLSASANFSSYERCDNQDPPDCQDYDSGSISVNHGSTQIGSISGNGSVNWSTTIDGGGMSQGEHTFSATASDSESVSHSASTTITIDNTPEVTIDPVGQVEGAFDLTGTVTFKERLGGIEGSVEVFINGKDRAHRVCAGHYEGTHITWRRSGPEMTGGEMLDAGTFSNGTHTIYARAQAANGALSEWVETTFTIDNTPVVSIDPPGQVEGAFDLTGTVTFKERLGGIEGSVEVF